MRRQLRWLLCAGAAGSAASVSGVAHADFVPGDMLVSVELSAVADEGQIYRVNAGGDFSGVTPDFDMPTGSDVPSPMHIIDMCSTDDGRVLVATSVAQKVYDVTSGELVEFASIPLDASALYCGHGKVFVTSFLLGSEMFDISAGGEVTESFASGVSRAPVLDQDGKIWASMFAQQFGNPGGVYRDIEKGDDLTGKTPWFDAADVFSAVLWKGRVMGTFATADGVADLTDGGQVTFGHAVLPGVRGITTHAGALWVSTIEGKVYDISQSADYTNQPPFATVPGPSLSIAVVQRCGDGQVDGREECDGGPDCRPDCTLPRCGDGTLDSGEGCDDGNHANGDGCSDTCEIEMKPTTVATSSSHSASSTAQGGNEGGAGAGGGGGDGDDPSSGCSVGGRDADGALLCLGLGLAAVTFTRRQKRASRA